MTGNTGSTGARGGQRGLKGSSLALVGAGAHAAQDEVRAPAEDSSTFLSFSGLPFLGLES